MLPYLQIVDRSSALTAFIGCTEKLHGETLSFLVQLNQHVCNYIRYVRRVEPGVQSCEMTLKTRTGSCRDSGWLMVQLMRRIGLASRFVSGYLIQLGTTSGDSVELRARAEVFIPRASWIGLDKTSALLPVKAISHLQLDPVQSRWHRSRIDRAMLGFNYLSIKSRIFEILVTLASGAAKPVLADGIQITPNFVENMLVARVGNVTLQ